MDWEKRHLDGKAGDEREEDPIALGGRERGAGVLDDCLDVEASGVVAEIDRAGEGKDGAGEGEEEEFTGSVAARGTAPDADDEEHGDEGEFEEDVEDEDVAGDEDAEHGALEQEHPGVIFAGPVLDAFEAGGDGAGHQQSGEENEPEADAVDAEGEGGVDGEGEGDVIESKLKARDVEMEGAECDEGDEKRGEADEQRPGFGGGDGDEGADDSAGGGEKEEDDQGWAHISA